jgi:hypothetical protein
VTILHREIRSRSVFRGEYRQAAGAFAQGVACLAKKDPGGLSDVAEVQALPKGRKSMAFLTLNI